MEVFFVNGEISKGIKREINNKYDLIFVDDSTSSKSRRDTIKEVIKMDTYLIVIHDFENINYRKDFFKNKSRMDKNFIPNTGIIFPNDVNEKKYSK